MPNQGTIMADFIPKQDPARAAWLTTLKSKLPVHAAALGLNSTQTAQLTADLDAHIASLQTVAQKKAEWLAATAAKRMQAETHLPALRAEIARWKTLPGMTDGILADLNISKTPPALVADECQPKLAVSLSGGQVSLKFQKRGASDVNLYVRLRGEPVWRLLVRVTNSPYADVTPVAVAGAAEVREYRAIGVLADQEIGQPSDIVSFTVAG